MSKERWAFHLLAILAWILLIVAFPDLDWWRRMALGFAMILFVVAHEVKDH